MGRFEDLACILLKFGMSRIRSHCGLYQEMPRDSRLGRLSLQGVGPRLIMFTFNSFSRARQFKA